MKPSDIELETPSKMFEYERISRDLDQVEDIETLRNAAKCNIKLYMKQQEVVAKLGMSAPD